jgi:DNA-binding transcriptional LysR family regulator
MDFSSTLLRTFIEVSRKGSFTLAASSVHRTQAAVSTQMHVLEKSIGLKLIDRSERPLRLTEAGWLFLQFAEETVNKAETLANFFKELAGGVAGQVRIGASLSVGTYLLPRLLGKLLKQYPKLQLNVFTQNREIVCDAVAQSRVDFGIVLSDEPPPNLQSTPLRSEPFYIVGAANHPLVKKTKAPIHNLQNTPFIVGMSNDYTQMVDRMLRSLGLGQYSIGFRISNFEGRKECVRAGVGVTVLPEFTVADEFKKRTLVPIKVKGTSLSASILLLENPRHLNSPSVNFVKGVIVKGIKD